MSQPEQFNWRVSVGSRLSRLWLWLWKLEPWFHEVPQPSDAYKAGYAAFEAKAPRLAPPFYHMADREDYLRGYDAADDRDRKMW